VILTGTELAAASRVLGHAARIASPASGATALTPAERARAFQAFQAAAFEALAWAETAVALQRAMPPTWRPMLAAVTAVAPSGLAAGSNDRFATSARASARVARLLLAAQLVEQLHHQRLVKAEAVDVRHVAARLLASLADVRLVAAQGPQRAAEQVVMLIGELMSTIPAAKDRLFRVYVAPADRYERTRDAVGYYLREFGQISRLDLARWTWRRRPRNRGWQLWRPALPAMQLADVDVATLIERADINSSARQQRR
jgi:hypothetical protein